MLNNFAIKSVFAWFLLALSLVATPTWGAEVIIVADTQLKPAAEVISGIRKTLKASIKIYAPADVKGALRNVADREDAKVIVALGREALGEALQLPSSIPVIFDLVVVPPAISRPNTTGFYMATPAKAYIDLLNNHLRSIRQVAVVGNHDHLNILARGETSQLTPYTVRNSAELVNTVRQLDTADAFLLLPDVSLLTATAMEEAYLLSFRKGIPLLGISEKQVREGALLALVVDLVSVGRQIGEYATNALRGVNVGHIPPSPPKKFDLYVNLDTARKMKIQIPDEMLSRVKRAYP